ncbi:hypothetical protein BH09MYX1_BH09MYX1_48750 [soil metagenome]
MRSIFLVLPMLAVACAGGGALEGHSDSPTSTAAAIAPTEAKIVSFERSPDSLRSDKVGGSDGALKPDGANDIGFSAQIEGTFVSILILTTDASGKPDGETQWDTITANEAMPPDLRGLVKSGGMTAGIGVFENGQVVNRPDGSLATTSGSHRFQLYVSNGPAFAAGAHVQIVVERPDHTVLRGPVVSF